MAQTTTSTTTMTVTLPAELVRGLKELASTTERDLADVVTEALSNHMELREWHRKAIAEAFAEIDAGAPTIPHEAVVAWVESWGTPDELPPPA